MRHFSELTEDEFLDLWTECVEAAVAYAKKAGIGGLSQAGSHNIYSALYDALLREARISKRIMNKAHGDFWDEGVEKGQVVDMHHFMVGKGKHSLKMSALKNLSRNRKPDEKGLTED